MELMLTPRLRSRCLPQGDRERAAGLTQYGIILAAVVAVSLRRARSTGRARYGCGQHLRWLDPVVLAAFVILFVLGFLMYSLLYAALGSLVSRQEDSRAPPHP